MALHLTVVDAFTSTPFTGNPAAVAVVEAFPEPTLMQSIAAEMNLSETAFCVPRPDGSFDLRWFTPTVEVPLCGHATLASAHVLGGSARFWTASGGLACEAVEDGWIAMDFPADPPSEREPSSGWCVAGAVWAGTSRHFELYELGDEQAVAEFEPDLAQIAATGSIVIVTAPATTAAADFVSRVFAPAAGIPEDPVTGSAHCALGPLWAGRLGRSSLVGRQLSRRGGTVRVDVEESRVTLTGRAVTVAEVEMAV